MGQSLTELHNALVAEHKRLSMLGDYNSDVATLRLLLRAVIQLIDDQTAFIEAQVQRDYQV